jgi:exoribonuclease-2
MNESSSPSRSDRARLRALAEAAMAARGLEPTFPSEALAEVAALPGPPTRTEEPTRDLRSLLWCSIDNDDSRDLDQLSVADPQPAGQVKVLVAIADVDAAVDKGSPVDRHAALNTTSVYTPAEIFPMLPERLSTDLTSLAQDADRLAIVIEMVISPDGALQASDVYGALVRNRAKLAYRSVGAWLAGEGPLPSPAAAIGGMDQQLRVQDGVAQALGRARHEHGALDFESIEATAEFDGDALRELRAERPNRAKALIENLMVAANGVTARFLSERRMPSLRRVVKQPERWDRIVALASETGDRLPATPDARALSAFLATRKAADPDGFVDLSHTVVKLLGRGEYAVDEPGQDAPGHFALAVKDYTHSTAPNRRYPDLITQRLLKAALAGNPVPYAVGELRQLADHCTRQEDAATKVERQMRKSAAALFVASRVGERFNALVTGVTGRGTFVRVVSPPLEGLLVEGARGVDVGDRIGVRLTAVDVDRGFIDFARA